VKCVLAILTLLLGQFSLVPTASAQTPQSKQTCQAACGAGSQPVLRECLARCTAGQPISREHPFGVAPVATPAQSTSGTPAHTPPQGAAEPPPPQVTFGAVYISKPPTGFGLAVGESDRLSAHRTAESACRATGTNCILAEDFVLPCAAVVEGVRRSPSALFMTSDPRTFLVRALTHGTASNPADAERIATEACRMQERGGLTCRVVFARCGPR